MENFGIDFVLFHQIHKVVGGKMIDDLPGQEDDDSNTQQVDCNEFPDQADFRDSHSIFPQIGNRFREPS